MTRKAVISGVAGTRMGKLEGSSVMSIHAEAALGALDDAGLALADIDGIMCSYSITEPSNMLSSVVSEYLGLHPTYSAQISAGGASGCLMVMTAKALIESGQCRHVLCVMGDNRLTGLPPGGAVAALTNFGHPQFEVPYGMTIPSCYGLVAQRYMHEYGTTVEQLAAISVSQRDYAARHPLAHMQKRITLDEVCNSRVIASPLRLFDCALVSDGGGAVIVSAADTVPDLKKAPIDILGTGQKHTHEHISQAPSLTEFGCREASQQAFAMAGLKPADMDVIEVYDSFTITLTIELESIGFFEKGEAGAAAAAGELGPDGRFPCNTHGGLLSFGHSGAAGGMFHIIEAVQQLRGECGDRQVADARLSYVHGDGGILSAHTALVLGRA
jgi:acetyl-CoA acetyltransferase